MEKATVSVQIQSLQIKGKENKPLVEPELNHIYLHKLRGYPL